jgi:hypothetical protein
MKALLIIFLALAFVVGGLLLLKSSAKTGLPSDEVVKRVKERERSLEEQEKREDS